MKLGSSLAAFGVLLLSLAGPVRAAPDHTLGTALMFAVVNDDGTLDRGSGVKTTTTDANAGQYRIVFDRDVSGCAYTVTVGSPFTHSGSGGSPLTPGVADVASLSGTPAGVFVETFDFAGTRVDRSFQLMVLCTK